MSFTHTVESRRYDHVYGNSGFLISNILRVLILDRSNVCHIRCCRLLSHRTAGHDGQFGKADHQYPRMLMTLNLQERVPDTGNMFSELPHHPRHGYRFGAQKNLPSGSIDFAPPQSNIPQNMEQFVTGRDRYKYFKKPVVPFLHAVPPEVYVRTTAALSLLTTQTG